MATCECRLAPVMKSGLTILRYLSLTTKLPFDDDEFDHVRMNDLGRGIPENKVRICHLWVLLSGWNIV